MCNMEQETKTIPAVEVWKPVKGYEGIYEVSDHARVRSLDRIARSKHRNGKSFTRKVKGHIITQRVNNNGYMTVRLSKDGESKIHLVHRLVAVAFVPNPYELPFVNHKDDTPKNNMPDNLEWCTNQYNVTYNNIQYRAKATRRKAVVQMTLDDKFVAEYESTHDAARKTGFHQGNIAGACRGQHNLLNVYGFHWKYKEQ